MTSILKVSTIQNTAGTAPTAGDLGLNVTGSVLQVLSTTKTDVFTSTSTTNVDITGLSVTITPKSATSKIFIMLNAHVVGNDAGTGLQLLRGSTEIAKADTSGSRSSFTAIWMYSNAVSPNTYDGGSTNASFLDSPATTSATTYKVQGRTLSSSGFKVNGSRYDVDNGNASRGVSTITVMEIAG